MTLNDGYDAVIVLGSVIRGETPHFDYICQGVTQGIARLNATNNIPVVFGLLTTENMAVSGEISSLPWNSLIILIPFSN